VLAAGAPVGAQRLRIGDPAPPLPITEWVKGQPQSLAAGKGQKIFVLEFWATWCLPCIQDIPKLNELQERYRADGVVVIGVTSPGAQRQKLEDVKRFVQQRGDQLKYTIAWDQTDATQTNYLLAAGSMGIPYTVIIGKDGNVAWHGYSSPDLERVLDELVTETFDVAKEAQRAKNDALIQEKLPLYAMEGRAGNWEAAVKILAEIIQIDPARFNPVKETYFIYTTKLEDPARLRLWIEAFIQEHAADADALVNICRVLLSIEDPAQRLPDLLLKAASTAREAGQDRDIDALSVYARAAHRVGNMDAAISAMRRAIEVAPQSRRAVLTQRMEYYQACKQLRDTKFQTP
jgi:thiol-disulfide isomerase/thioredoxin